MGLLSDCILFVRNVFVHFIDPEHCGRSANVPIKSKKYTASVSHMIDTGAKYYHYTFRRGQQLAPATIDTNSAYTFFLNCDTPQ